MTGFCKMKASDPEEQRLRDNWYAAKALAETSPSPSNALAFYNANKALSDFLWRRANTIVAHDRAKHPKAKRNMPVGAMGSGSGGRILP